MVTNELLAFVKEELSKGRTEEEIRKALMEGGGWSELDVKEAFDATALYSHTYQDAAKVLEDFLASLSAKFLIIACIAFGILSLGGYLVLLKYDKAPAKMSLIDRLEERARRFKAFADKFSAAATKALSELLEKAIALLHRFADWLVEIANTIKRTLTRVRQAVWWVIQGLLMVFKYYSPGVVCLILAWVHSSWRSFWVSLMACLWER
jgi:hypothetical protein